MPESLRGLCRIIRNDTPARFTGNLFRWIVESPNGRTYCDTRQSARDTVAAYKAERRALLREGLKQQARAEFYHG